MSHGASESVSQDVRRHALYEALNRAGGVTPLAAIVNSSASSLLSFAAGMLPVPDALYVQLRDFILDQKMRTPN